MAATDTETRMATAFLSLRPGDAARVLEARPARETAELMMGVDAESAAAVFQRMLPDSASACIAHLPAEHRAAILERLELDSSALLLRMTPEVERTAIVASLPRKVAEPLRRLLTYPEGTAGAVMDPNVFAVASDTTVRAATERLRRNPRKAIYYVYVVDRDRNLVGVMTLRELLLADRDAPVSSVMQPNPLSIRATASQLDLVQHAGWRRFHSMPVIGDADGLVGVVRYDTLRKLESELTVKSPPQGGLDLVLSLGEMYAKGLTGLISGLVPSDTTTAVAAPGAPAPGRG